MNCWPPPEATFVEFGETETLTVDPAATFTVALALLVVSAALVARTVTDVELATWGAVKSPPLVMVPALTDQVTAVLLVPETLVENCWVPPEARLAVLGETEMLTVDPERALIVMWQRTLAVAFCASVTVTQKYLLRTAVGVPFTAPVPALRAKPEGRLPSLTEYR